MAKEVVKKDGSREPFDAQKIKDAIAIASQEAGLTEEKIEELVASVSAAVFLVTDAKETIATSEIKEKILSELDAVAPSVSAVWREYDQKKQA